MRIGVVIPFFQREGGILRRALDSVAAQDLPEGATVEVVVVDDASPAPVEGELDGWATAGGLAVTVLSQPNGGPGAARNRGLDHLAETGVDYVAFLDSDDEWSSRHLREAVDALVLGYDFYFCDNHRPGQAVSEADRVAQAIQRLRDGRGHGVAWLTPDGTLFAVEPERLLTGYLDTYISQTSTVVLNGVTARTARFDPRLRGAGEDYMYWIDLTLSGVRTVASLSVNVACGTGVNLWFSAFDFGSAKVVDRMGYSLMFWRTVSHKLRMRGRSTRSADDRTGRYGRAYSYLFVRALLLRQRPSFELFRTLAREDPLLIPAMPFRFLSVLPRRAAEALTW